MVLKACDIFTTVCQTFLFVWITDNIASKNNKLSKVKYYGLISIIFVEVFTLTYSGINIPLANVLIAVGILVLIIGFYRKSILDAFLGFGLAYSIIVIVAYFLSTFYQHVIIKLNLNISQDIKMLLFIYIPGWATYALVYLFRKYIFDTCTAMKNYKQSLVFILLIDYALIFLDSLHMEWTTESMGLTLKSILYFTAFIIFFFTTIYFAKINNKSKEVELLNAALNEKITELKKIKHDYGSEISSLYGLYQMGKMDRIGILLKGIVERYQGASSGVNVSIQATPLVASVLNYAIRSGIDVIIFDGGNYDNLAVCDNDLIKLLANIVKNSIDVLNGVANPTINYKSYNSYKGITITISNNGPKIPQHVKNKMFDAGFSTKENKNGDRGFGLSIVTDIIKNCNGEISVDSNDEWTQFKLQIPYRAM